MSGLCIDLSGYAALLPFDTVKKGSSADFLACSGRMADDIVFGIALVSEPAQTGLQLAAIAVHRKFLYLTKAPDFFRQ